MFGRIAMGTSLWLVVTSSLLACGDGTSTSSTGSGGAGAQTSTSSGGEGGASTSTGGSGGAPTGTSTGGSGGGPICTPGETTSCYSGPDGTQDVGICVAGLATCEADGTYGPCVGEILPSIDDCETADDEDCSGANDPCTGPGSAEWTIVLGGSPTNGVGVGKPRLNPAGDILLSLSSSEAMSLGNGVSVDAGPSLATYDQSGSPLGANGWSPEAGGIDPGPIEFLVKSKHEAGLLSIASTFPIELYEYELDGTFRGLWDVGTATPPPGSPDSCFAFNFESSVNANPHELSLAGDYRGTVVLGGQTISNGSFDHDLVYARLETPTTPKFVETIQATDAGKVSLATLPSGDMIVSAEAVGPLAHGTTTLTTDTGRGYLLVRVDGTTGAIAWSKWFPSGVGSSNVSCGVAFQHIAALADGSFAVAFDNPYNLDVDGTMLSGQLGLALFDGSGNLQWTVAVPKVLDMNPSSLLGTVVAGDDGSIVWAGNMNGVFDFGAGPVGVWSINNDTDGIVVKYDAATGALSWQRVFEYVDGSLWGAAVAPGGAVLVTGGFQQSLTVSGQQFAAPSQNAAWLTRLAP